MTPSELAGSLAFLRLPQAEAAQLLGVAPRTERRWLDGEAIPGPAEQAFRAWRRLHERNLAWRPDSESIVEDDQEEIARLREHAIGLGMVVARVEARGGPRLPWLVDRRADRAVLGTMQVSLYRLPNGSYSLGAYTRRDGATPDVKRDWEFIEDAWYCIVKEMRKEAAIPVLLIYSDRSIFVGPAGRVGKVIDERFDSNDAAILRACELAKGLHFHSPSIKDAKTREVIWTEPEIRQEIEYRAKAAG
jgi:hypothetical protein